MLKRSIRTLSWWLLMLAMVLGVALIGVRQFLLPAASQQRAAIASYIGDQLGVSLGIGRLKVQWRGYFPALQAGDIRVFAPTDQGPEVRLAIRTLTLQLDPWRSLFEWQPVFQNFEVSGAEALWYQRDGRWLHRPGAGEGGSGLTESHWRKILALLLSQPRIHINDARVTLIPQRGEIRRLAPINALLENAGAQHQLSGDLRIPSLGDETDLQFAIQSQGVSADPLQSDYPFYLKLNSLGPELFNLFDINLPLHRLRAGTEFWGHLRQGKLQGVQGKLAVGDLEYGKDDSRIALTNSSLDFALLPRDKGYQLQLNDIHLNSSGAKLTVPQLVFDGGYSDGKLQPERIMSPGIDLAALTGWLDQQALLPIKIRESLKALAPQGRLDNLLISWPQSGQWREARLQADAKDLTVKAYYGAPAVKGVYGRLDADLAGGRLDLKSERFAMHFPKEFPQGWSFTHADGVVKWHLRSDGVLVDSDLLHLRDSKVSASGRFSMDIPYDHERQTELTLLIGMTDSDGREAQRFTPPREVGEGLYHWLGSAIKAGDVRKAGLLLHVGTRQQKMPRPPTVQLFFDIGKATLKYDPAWPEITDADLFMMIRDGDLRIDIRKAKLLDSQVQAGWAYKPLHDDRLQVAALLSGPAGDVDKVLHSAPLQDSVGKGLDDWALSGQLATTLQLSIPVEGDKKALPQVNVDATLSDGTFASKAQRLQITGLQGNVRFSTAAGLSSKGLKGLLFGAPMKSEIQTQEGVTIVSFEGKAPMESVREWSAIAPLQLVTGQLPYSAWLVICNSQKGCKNRFELSSSLVGTAVDLPGDYGLAAEQSGMLKVSAQLDPPRRLAFDYQKFLHGRFDLDAPSLRGALSLGDQPARLHGGDGLYVDGALPSLSAEQLFAVIDKLESLGGDQNGGESALRQVDLRVDHFAAGDMTFNQVSSRVTPSAGGWQVRLDGKEVAGVVSIPADDSPVQLKLNRLAVGKEADAAKPDVTPEAVVGNEVKPGPVSNLLSADSLPKLDIDVADLRYKGRQWGRWRMQVRPEGRNVRVQNIIGKLSQLQVQGEASWQQGQGGHTGVTLQIKGQDIGKQLDVWKLPRAIESASLSSRLQLDWVGAPWQLKASALDGSVQFNAKDGRLIESGNSANLLRVFGILNFNTLGRRLRLDFSDLFKKGVVFDTLSGNYDIRQGIARTRTPLVMKGPSADLKATGSLDLVHETVDKQIEVVLPLSSNVPFAAVLLGAPQVAGAVFLIDKLIGDKLEKVTTLRYNLTGDWGDPQVDLQTSPPAKQDKSGN